jgi:hypothetical protein
MLCALIKFLVDGGHRAVIFDRFAGIKNEVTGEGTSDQSCSTLGQGREISQL